MGIAIEEDTKSSISDGRFHKVVNELEAVKKEVVSMRDWYKRNSSRPRVLFRTVGIVTITLSITIPFLGILEGIWRTYVVPVAAVTIAISTSLNTFFQWQGQWQWNRQTQYALEYLLLNWEIEMIKARAYTDREKAIEIAIEATRKLLEQTREITSSTTGEFFKSIQLPTTK